MNLYLLEQDLNSGYDTYDSCVVAAENEEEARNIHPSEFVTHIKNGIWMGTYNNGGEYVISSYDWINYSDINKLKVTLIGKASENIEKGVVLASFNAG